MTREEGCTFSESENCDSKIEKSEASFKVENQKSENLQALNEISRDPSHPIQFKEGNTEVDDFAQFLGKVLYSYATCALKNIKPVAELSPSNIIYHSDINKAVSLNKKLNKTENSKDITNESFLRKKMSVFTKRWMKKANEYVEKFSNKN